jgi:hypothetical protein
MPKGMAAFTAVVAVFMVATISMMVFTAVVVFMVEATISMMVFVARVLVVGSR